MSVATDLEFVSTEELIKELISRHNDLIIIKDVLKIEDKNALFIKTRIGCLGKAEKGFDLLIATQMLETALRMAITHYLEEGEQT